MDGNATRLRNICIEFLTKTSDESVVRQVAGSIMQALEPSYKEINVTRDDAVLGFTGEEQRPSLFVSTHHAVEALVRGMPNV